MKDSSSATTQNETEVGPTSRSGSTSIVSPPTVSSDVRLEVGTVCLNCGGLLHLGRHDFVVAGYDGVPKMWCEPELPL